MKKITIYTGPVCNYCDAAKRLLKRNNASFTEINIAEVDGAFVTSNPPRPVIPWRAGPRTWLQLGFNTPP